VRGAPCDALQSKEDRAQGVREYNLSSESRLLHDNTSFGIEFLHDAEKRKAVVTLLSTVLLSNVSRETDPEKRTEIFSERMPDSAGEDRFIGFALTGEECCDPVRLRIT